MSLSTRGAARNGMTLVILYLKTTNTVSTGVKYMKMDDASPCPPLCDIEAKFFSYKCWHLAPVMSFGVWAVVIVIGANSLWAQSSKCCLFGSHCFYCIISPTLPLIVAFVSCVLWACSSGCVLFLQLFFMTTSQQQCWYSGLRAVVFLVNTLTSSAVTSLHRPAAAPLTLSLVTGGQQQLMRMVCLTGKQFTICCISTAAGIEYSFYVWLLLTLSL